MKALIEMGADRGAFIDQSASLNLFQESPTIGKLSSMYMYAWKKGIKSTYYLRSRPATSIAKVTLAKESSQADDAANTAMMNATKAALAAQIEATRETAAGNAAAMDAANLAAAEKAVEKKVYSDSEAIACSLENPESCEACS